MTNPENYFPQKLFHISLDDNTYILLKSDYSNNNINIRHYTELNSKQTWYFHKNYHLYYITNIAQLSRLLKTQQTLEDISHYFFNAPIPVLDLFTRKLLHRTLVSLSDSYLSDFKQNLFEYALQMSQKSPAILRLFMEKYLGFNTKDTKEQEEQILPLPQQLLSLLEDNQKE